MAPTQAEMDAVALASFKLYRQHISEAVERDAATDDAGRAHLVKLHEPALELLTIAHAVRAPEKRAADEAYDLVYALRNMRDRLVGSAPREGMPYVLHWWFQALMRYELNRMRHDRRGMLDALGDAAAQRCFADTLARQLYPGWTVAA